MNQAELQKHCDRIARKIQGTDNPIKGALLKSSWSNAFKESGVTQDNIDLISARPLVDLRGIPYGVWLQIEDCDAPNTQVVLDANTKEIWVICNYYNDLIAINQEHSVDEDNLHYITDFANWLPDE